MAKIYLKFNRPAIIVDDNVANDIKTVYDESVKNKERLDLILKTVSTPDGISSFHFNEISGFDLPKKQKRKYTFTNEDGIARFHEKYGNIKASIVDGYGLVDRDTQFMLDSGIMKFVEGRFGLLLVQNTEKPEEDRQKLSDLWKEYNEEHRPKLKNKE